MSRQAVVATAVFVFLLAAGLSFAIWRYVEDAPVREA